MDEKKILEFIRQKPSREELYDLKFANKLYRFYIDRFTNNYKLFFKNIKNIIFFLKIYKKNKILNHLSNDKFIKKSIANIGFNDFGLYRLIHLKEILKKKNPKKILEIGSGMSTIYMSTLINEFKLDCKIYSLENDPVYLDKIIKNNDQDVLKNIVFIKKELKVFKYNNRRYVSHDNVEFIEHIDILYIDGPVLYKFKEFDGIKYIKSGDVIDILTKQVSIPTTIITDKKYDLYPTIKKFNKYNAEFDPVFWSIIYEKKSN